MTEAQKAGTSVPDYTALCKEDVDRPFRRMKQELYTMVEENMPEILQKLAKSFVRQVCNECWHTILRLNKLEEEDSPYAFRDTEEEPSK
jgi:methionyl-tRNA synthetase